MDHDIIGRVQWFAVECFSQHRYAPVMLVAYDAMSEMLARELASLIVKRIAIAVLSGKAKPSADMLVFFKPAELFVVGDVAPDEKTSYFAPGGTFRQKRATMKPLDGSVPEPILQESLVQHDDIRVRVPGWLSFRSKVPGEGGACHSGHSSQSCGNAKEAAPVN